jgi:hypothetical protein
MFTKNLTNDRSLSQVWSVEMKDQPYQEDGKIIWAKKFLVISNSQNSLTYN